MQLKQNSPDDGRRFDGKDNDDNSTTNTLPTHTIEVRRQLNLSPTIGETVAIEFEALRFCTIARLSVSVQAGVGRLGSGGEGRSGESLRRICGQSHLYHEKKGRKEGRKAGWQAEKERKIQRKRDREKEKYESEREIE